MKASEDGNCFFNCLSLFFTNNEKYNYLFRHLLYAYCKDFQNEI